VRLSEIYVGICLLRVQLYKTRSLCRRCVGCVLQRACVGCVLQRACVGCVLQRACVGCVLQRACLGCVLQRACVGCVLQRACVGCVLQRACRVQVSDLVNSVHSLYTETQVFINNTANTLVSDYDVKPLSDKTPEALAPLSCCHKTDQAGTYLKTGTNHVWAYYAHGRQRRCQEDPISLPSGRLEKTTRSSPHHVAQHRPTGSETTPPCALQSSRFGSEPPCVEEDVDVWRYAILEFHARNDDD